MPALATTTVTGTIYRASGATAVDGTKVWYRCVEPPEGTGSGFVGSNEYVETVGGAFTAPVLQSAEYEFWIEGGPKESVIVGTSSTPCPRLIGRQTAEDPTS